jgi:hypothetical protein
MHLTLDPKVSYQTKPGLEDFEQGHAVREYAAPRDIREPSQPQAEQLAEDA